MADTTKKMQMGATPGKLALIGVLAVVFVAVLVMQFGDNQGAGDAGEELAVVNPGPAAAGASPVRLPPVEKPGDRVWPTFSREEVAAFDPFALSPKLGLAVEGAAFVPATRPLTAEQQREIAQQHVERQEALAGLLSQGVSMLFQDKDGLVATIGDRTVRVGDVIDGFRVVTIGPTGIVLEPAKQPQGGRFYGQP